MDSGCLVTGEFYPDFGHIYWRTVVIQLIAAASGQPLQPSERPWRPIALRVTIGPFRNNRRLDSGVKSLSIDLWVMQRTIMADV